MEQGDHAVRSICCKCAEERCVYVALNNVPVGAGSAQGFGDTTTRAQRHLTLGVESASEDHDLHGCLPVVGFSVTDTVSEHIGCGVVRSVTIAQHMSGAEGLRQLEL